MKTSTILRTAAASMVAMGLLGCGGGSLFGKSDQEKAVDLIADYAASSANAKPGVNDYDKAGVDGVISENVDAVNAMVDKGTRSDYDSRSEIQDLVDKIGRDKTAVLDRNFGDGEHDFIYGIVTSAIGKVWLNNNLGAAYADTNNPNFDAQQQATSKDDFLAYGSLFQWGRKADGHELIIYTDETHGHPKYPLTTTIQNDNPSHNKFIKGNADWRKHYNNGLWTGVNAPNAVCPAGYRLPTAGEMAYERNSWGGQKDSDAFDSPLHWNNNGYRAASTGSILFTKIYGLYWTSAYKDNVSAYRLYFGNTGSGIQGNRKAAAEGVRCIKD